MRKLSYLTSVYILSQDTVKQSSLAQTKIQLSPNGDPWDCIVT